MSTMHLRVVTPERPVYEGNVASVVVPAHDGEVGILPGHAHFLARLGYGVLRVDDAGHVHRWFLDGGFVQVGGNRVTVLCTRATEMDALDAAAAEQQAERATTAGDPTAAALRQRAAAIRRVLVGAGGTH